MLDQPWRIEMLGGLRVRRGAHVITRFRTQKTGGLLAYLAYHPDRPHSREVLLEMLWPESDPDASRNSLRVALSSLRAQLEPPGVPAGSVLQATRSAVWLNPQAFATDVGEFEAALQGADRASSDDERHRCLSAAMALYRGAFLPGCYEEWVSAEQECLAERFVGAAREAAKLLEQAGDLRRAVECCHQAVAVDPLREELHRELIRLLLASGEPGAALDHYRRLEEILETELGAAPDAATRALVSQLPGADAHQRASRQPGARHPPPLAAPIAAPRAGVSLSAAHSGTPFAAGADGPRLPVQLTRFFGREQELAQLREMLRPAADTPDRTNNGAHHRRPAAPSSPCSRLLTLTGPAGVGKTRLAVEAGGHLADAYRGAVCFTPLQDVADPRRIPDAIASALGLPRMPNVDPLEQAASALSRRPSLLILDNCEHLVEEGAERISALLEKAGTLTLLATSRRLLGLAGELAFPLDPLPIPNGPDTPEQLSFCPSICLFVDRALAAKPDFRITLRNAPAVAGLCDRLEGVPLAIELAAARSQALTPAQMLSQLPGRFALLVTRRRGVVERHRSLLAAVEWSYRLLSPELRRFFCRLSVFRGGWTAEAAGAVCLPAGGGSSALDPLTELQANSLVVAEEHDGEMRFRMLETLREFAAERLEPEERAAVQRRHAEWCLALAEEAEPRLRGPGQVEWCLRLDDEHENIRAALGWCENESPELHFNLAMHMAQFWEIRGHYSEGRRWLESALRDGDATAAQWRARTSSSAGRLAWYQGDFPVARAHLTEGVAIFRDLGESDGLSVALGYLGEVASRQGDYPAAQAALQESLALARELGNTGRTARSLYQLGQACLSAASFTEARQVLEESVSLSREAGDDAAVAIALEFLGTAVYYQGDLSLAQTLLEEALDLAARVNERFAWGFACWALARVATAQGDYARARSHLLGMRQVVAETGNGWAAPYCLEAFAYICAGEGQYRQAARFLGAAAALRHEIDSPLAPSNYAVYEGAVAAIQRAIGEAAFAEAYAGGKAMTLSEALAILESELGPCAPAGPPAELPEAGWSGPEAPGGVEPAHREAGGSPTEWHARALCAAGRLAWLQGDYPTARSLLQEGLSRCRSAGDTEAIAATLTSLGELAYREGDFASARGLYEEALATTRALDQRTMVASILHKLGQTLHSSGDSESALPVLEESLALSRTLDDRVGISAALVTLGMAHLNRGDHEPALRVLLEARAISREMGDKQQHGMAAWALGNVMREEGDYQSARAYYEEAFSVVREGDMKWGVCYLLEAYGYLASAEGEMERAARLLGAAEAIRAALGAPRAPSNQAVYERYVGQVRAALGEEALKAAWESGAATPMRDAIAYALGEGATSERRGRR